MSRRRTGTGVGIEHQVTQGVQPLRRERAEDILFGSFGGAQAGAQLSGPCRGELDPSAAPVFGVDLAPDQRSCLEAAGAISQAELAEGINIDAANLVELLDQLAANESVASLAEPIARQEEFWGELYGQITDPFGHRWGVAEHIRDELERAVTTAFGG